MTDKVTLMEEHPRLISLIEQVLQKSRVLGVDAAEVSIVSGNGLYADVHLGKIDKLEYERDKDMSLTLYFNHCQGSASTSDFSDAAIDNIINAAYQIAKHTGADKHAGLADVELIASRSVDLDLHHPWDISPEKAIDMAINCEQHAFSLDKRIINSDGVSVSTYSGISLYGNTHDFIDGYPWSVHTIDCTLVAEHKLSKQRDGWYSKSRDWRELQAINHIAERAAQNTINRLGARKLSTRKAPVIFDAPVAKGLFSAFISAISGESLYRKASFLQGQKGEQVFARHINIREEPHIKKGLGSAPFDSDGVTTYAHDIVKDGVLECYVLGAYAARRLGMQTTANAGGVHNLIVAPGTLSLQEMLKEMDTGFLITDMIGFGVNQITGDYSRGASGFWIENGEPAYPVEEVTVAGNLKEIYRQMLIVGSELDQRSNIQTAPVLIESMTIAGE